MWGPSKKVGLISSVVLTFIRHRQTDTRTDKKNMFKDWLLFKYFFFILMLLPLSKVHKANLISGIPQNYLQYQIYPQLKTNHWL